MLIQNKRFILVLFGATGDLSMRMLIPSLYYLEADQYLPEHFQIIAIARKPLSREDFIELAQQAFIKNRGVDDVDQCVWQRFASRIEYINMDMTQQADYQCLKKALGDKSETEVIYYLAIPPDLYATVCQHLQHIKQQSRHSRLVLEKPLGRDLTSAQMINHAITAVFSEEDVFRIDHYLGKETVQNLLAIRFANRFFEPLWDSSCIDHVQITVSETVGVEARWSYFDAYGVLRDMIQNHILQLLCLVAMEPPAEFGADAIRNEKVKVLKSLRLMNAIDIQQGTVRGQYTAGSIFAEKVSAYVDESEHLSASKTETFVAAKVNIDNWRWAGVPFYIRAGKRLSARYSEIYIQFKHVPHSIFANAASGNLVQNSLLIRLQPEENISLKIMGKVPGLSESGVELVEIPLDVNLTRTFNKLRRRIAYERLFLDVINNNAMLFVRRDEIEAAWRWVDCIIDGWQHNQTELEKYTAGSTGPLAAKTLIENDGRVWHGF